MPRHLLVVMFALILSVGCSGAMEPTSTAAVSTATIVPGDMSQTTVPTPTLSVPPDATIANARLRLARENPKWTDFLTAVESSNVQQVLGYLDWQQHQCTATGSHGGDAPLCGSLGLADGSSVSMFPEDGRGALPLPQDQLGEAFWFRDRSSMEAALAQLLSGRHPTLELVLQGDDKQLYLSFSLDPAPHPDSGSVIVSVSFRAPDPKTAILHVFAQGVASTTPFEVVKNLQRQGHTFDIWGVSDQLLARERVATH